MKKLVSLICSICIAASLCACGSSENTTKESSVSEAASSVAEETSPYTLEADFSKGESADFSMSDGWSNGGQFNCTWLKKNVAFADGLMKLTIDSLYDDSFSGAEYRSNEMCGYGLYEVSMKPISNNGVVSSFFTYTGPSDSNPWDEVDIEFLGKDTTKVQFNYFTDGKGNHEYVYDLGFDASKEFHTYGFNWSKDSIVWYVDGKEVYTATENLPTTPGKIMMNVWNGIGVDSWLRAFDKTVPLTAEYQFARFTKE